jgi:hypothetical protein
MELELFVSPKGSDDGEQSARVEVVRMRGRGAGSCVVLLPRSSRLQRAMCVCRIVLQTHMAP